jgi:hypothetical protein
MKKTLQQLMFGGLCAAILVAGNANAQTNKTTKVKVSDTKAKDAVVTPKPKREWYPFYGTVAAVDTKAKTVSLKKIEGVRVLQTDDKTTLEMNGKPASLADIKTGYYLHGKLHKDTDKDEAILDAKIEKEAPHTKASTKMENGKPAVVPAVPAAEETATNAPAKNKKKIVTQ